MLPSPPPMQSPVVQTPKSHQSQSLASHFNIYPLIEKLSKEIEIGSSDSMLTELNSQFENCQQILNSISVSLGSKAMTVDGQKLKLDESNKLLEQRRLSSQRSQKNEEVHNGSSFPLVSMSHTISRATNSHISSPKPMEEKNGCK